MLLEDLEKVAQDAARQAGKHALHNQTGARVEFKDGIHIVTELDRQCQAGIIQNIASHWPEHGFIGEEGTDGKLFKQPPTGNENIWWVIDPIDGTRNFAHGAPQFSVSLAAMREGIVLAGVIYDPATDTLFSARQGHRTTCNNRTIRCRQDPMTPNSQVAIPSKTPKAYSPCLQELMAKYICMNLGSAAMHLAYVALGAYHAAFSWEVKLWDIAAGMIINQSADAQITDFNANALGPIDCHAYQGQSIPILVATETAHENMLQVFQRPTADND